MSSGVILDKPTAARCCVSEGRTLTATAGTGLTVDAVRLVRLPAEHALLKHLERTDREPFTPRDLRAAFLRRVLPLVTGSGVHEDADDHQVDEVTGLLERVDLVLFPPGQDRVDAVPDKVPPPSVWRDRVVVGPVIALDQVADKVDDLVLLREVERPVIELVLLR